MSNAHLSNDDIQEVPLRNFRFFLLVATGVKGLGVVFGIPIALAVEP